jgi:serine/threonine protein kinase
MELGVNLESGLAYLAQEDSQETKTIKVDGEDVGVKASGSMAVIYANSKKSRAYKVPIAEDDEIEIEVEKQEAYQAAIDRERIRYRQIEQEIGDSPSFLKYYDEEGWFERNGSKVQALALELLEGECLKLERLSPRLFIFVLGELFAAICQYAKIGIIHRDLYEGNILVDSGLNRVVVIDFGMSKHKDESDTGSQAVPTAPSYKMTEARRPKQERDNIRSDVYCVGLIIYKYLKSKEVFDGQAHRDTVKQSAGDTVSSKLGFDDSSKYKAPLPSVKNSSSKKFNDVKFLESLGDKCWRDTGPRKKNGPPTVDQEGYDAIPRISPSEALQLIIDHLYGAQIGVPSNANTESALSLDEESLAVKREYNAQNFAPDTGGLHDDRLETEASEEAGSGSLASELPAIGCSTKSPGAYLGRHVISRHFITAGTFFFCAVSILAFAAAFLYRREAISATDNVDSIAAIWLEGIANNSVPSTDELLKNSEQLLKILEGVNNRSQFKSFFNGLQKLSAIKADKGQINVAAEETGDLYAKAIGVDSEDILRNYLSRSSDDWKKLAFNMYSNSFSSKNPSLQYKYVLDLCGDIYGNYGDFLFDIDSSDICAKRAYEVSEGFRRELSNISEDFPQSPWKPLAMFKLAQCKDNLYKVLQDDKKAMDLSLGVKYGYHDALLDCVRFETSQKGDTASLKGIPELKADIAYNFGWSIFRPFSPLGVNWVEKNNSERQTLKSRLDDFTKLRDNRKMLEIEGAKPQILAKYTSGLYLIAMDLIESQPKNDNSRGTDGIDVTAPSDFVAPLRDSLDSKKYLDDEGFIKVFVGLPGFEKGEKTDPRFDKYMLRLLIKAGRIAGKDREVFFSKICEVAIIKEADLNELSHEVWPQTD